MKEKRQRMMCVSQTYNLLQSQSYQPITTATSYPQGISYNGALGINHDLVPNGYQAVPGLPQVHTVPMFGQFQIPQYPSTPYLVTQYLEKPVSEDHYLTVASTVSQYSSTPPSVQHFEEMHQMLANTGPEYRGSTFHSFPNSTIELMRDSSVEISSKDILSPESSSKLKTKPLFRPFEE
jgi:hypothetical protein